MQTQIPIYETENFYIQAASRPFIDRTEGGHVYMFPKIPVRDRTQLSPKLAIEYMKLSMVVGEALKLAMAKRGVDIGLVNYQDMGNWGVFKPEGPTLHMQIMAAPPQLLFKNMETLYFYHTGKPAFMIIFNR
jgi:diadenosine tetraphosphate (Ap4A) HIT family hydrolase